MGVVLSAGYRLHGQADRRVPVVSRLSPGFDLNLEDGIIRARYRKSLAKETMLTPGAVEPVTIRLYPTSNVFKKGHRIRLDVSSSNYPRFDINPNTGEPQASPAAANSYQYDLA
ncbi:MAG: CocE/NonD family hydrolase C-terminal non-catalytic domain-containing protein [Gemmatimonadaceae bacterium]